MARASAGVMSAARTVVSASTVASAATRVVFVFIVVFLVVVLLDLSRNFSVDCLRNDTVNVSCVILHYAALGISSSIGLWGNIPLEPVSFTTEATFSPGVDNGYCLSRTFLSVAAFSSADICFGPSFTVN